MKMAKNNKSFNINLVWKTDAYNIEYIFSSTFHIYSLEVLLDLWVGAEGKDFVFNV